MSKEKKIPVTFKKPWRGYNTGETAGFDEDTVERLHKAKLIEEPAQAKGRRSQSGKGDGGDGKSPPGGDKQPPDGAGGTGQGDPDDDTRP